jgi:uncharacterized protein with GYD domain
MATYILLMRLTPAGQLSALNDPEYLLRVEESIHVPGVQALGIYGVLGEYDFVSIAEADSNETIAMFSLELGVKANVHVTTLPAVPLARLEARRDGGTDELETDIALSPPAEERGLDLAL